MREATIQRILEVKPVENSDFLDVVKVLGWQVVTKRNDFKVGDLCIYVTLDSIVPEKPEFEFLRKEHFRIRTMKLRGELSQGIVFPLGILNEEWLKLLSMLLTDARIDLDVTEALGITHYEKPIPVEMKGLIKSNFPPYVPKTDEDRIQNYPAVLTELRGTKVYATCKMDGTSWTCVYHNGEIQICTRNNSLKLEGNDDNIYVRMLKKYDLQNKLEKYGKNIAIQAELCGPGIQKNRIELKKHQLYVFNVYFIDERRYGNINDVIGICVEFGLPMVPVLDVWELKENMVELLEMAKGKYEGTTNDREGIVIRPVNEMYSNVMKGRMSFKVLNNDFLVKNKE